MQKIDYCCLACNKNLLSITKLNKHMQICDKYEEWLKTYKPVYFKCKSCLKSYATEEFLKNHECRE
jgi:hypothetical protein